MATEFSQLEENVGTADSSGKGYSSFRCYPRLVHCELLCIQLKVTAPAFNNLAQVCSSFFIPRITRLMGNLQIGQFSVPGCFLAWTSLDDILTLLICPVRFFSGGALVMSHQTILLFPAWVLICPGMPGYFCLISVSHGLLSVLP